MIAQLDLPLSSRNKKSTQADLNRLKVFLDWYDRWVTAKEICAELEWNDRYVRKLAEESNGTIIGTDAGYRLTSRVTPEEFNEWRGRYESQVKRMLERIQRTSSAWHGRGV